ncbi:MAG: NTP transferase domain-containing protein [Lutibacter sp.]|nr:NTP transferase domain-containing protein [Lutibacter sp.]
MKTIHAVIMAGGLGSRLRPLTYVLPKPLMPLDNETTIIEVIISQLCMVGVNRITITTGYFSDILSCYVNKKFSNQVRIDIVEEVEPMGTIGSLSLIQFEPDELILLLNADILTTLDFDLMIQQHISSKVLLTVATYPFPIVIEKGVITIDSDNYVSTITEKPTLKHNVSMGLYLINPEIVGMIPSEKKYDAPDLMNQLLAKGEKVGAFFFDGYWLDIGLPSDYEKALKEFPLKRKDLLKGENN